MNQFLGRLVMNYAYRLGMVIYTDIDNGWHTVEWFGGNIEVASYPTFSINNFIRTFENYMDENKI
jgi:hypothetical protein